MAEVRALNITTSGSHSIKQVAKELEKAGLRNHQVLDAIGVITGSADEDTIEKLRGIEGVADISSDVAIEIGPPDSDETW
jgi:hypothetical protein